MDFNPVKTLKDFVIEKCHKKELQTFCEEAFVELKKNYDFEIFKGE